MRTFNPFPFSPRIPLPIPHSNKKNAKANIKENIFRGYSAHEHTVLSSNVRLSSTSANLPQDIAVETLVSLVVVSLGLVLGAEKLKPISWSEWAGEIEREGGARNPYRRLEERYSFWDIRVGGLLFFSLSLIYRDSVKLTLGLQAKRKEFAEWIRGQDALAKE